jgi:dTDP-4-dehydrorhamnose 3,5-epimerase
MTDLSICRQPLPGVHTLKTPSVYDHRGSLAKLFHYDSLAQQGISFKPAESFLTKSKFSVLRGMHFQIGNAAHEKLVTCIKGRVLDVVVDVSPDSRFFNKPFAIELAENKEISLLIGKGYAHGFLSLDHDCWMLYSTTTIHCPSLDKGVLWSSIDFDWPISNPILSPRDLSHPRIV